MAYSKKVMDHFMHPRNMGDIKNADGIGKVGNPACGDVMWMYIKVGKDKEGKKILSDLKFKTFGCGAAIATSSMMTELAKNKSLDEARKISNKNVAEALEGLPPVKMHCSNLAEEALNAAIDDYEKNLEGKNESKENKEIF